MNELERADALRVGPVIRAARKLRGLSQSEVARELQVSQTTVSSIESGEVAISGSNWLRLSRLLRVLPDHTFFEGIVDSANINGLDDPLETGFKLPKRYANNAFSTVRAAQPFFRFFECCCGRAALDEFLKERMNVDPDIRYIYNLRLSIRFNLDLASHLIRAGHLTLNTLDLITSQLVNPKTHGLLAKSYQDAAGSVDLLKQLLKNVALYERNFSYSLVNESRNSLEIASMPADFMRYFSYKEDELPDFINLYRRSFIESFSKYRDRAQPVRVRIIPSATKRRTECLFKIAI